MDDMIKKIRSKELRAAREEREELRHQCAFGFETDVYSSSSDDESYGCYSDNEDYFSA